MRITPDIESEILNAVRTVYKKSGEHEIVIARTVISLEIMENPRDYPALKRYNLSERRKWITMVCDRHFEPFSTNWRNGAWMITRRCLHE